MSAAAAMETAAAAAVAADPGPGSGPGAVNPSFAVMRRALHRDPRFAELFRFHEVMPPGAQMLLDALLRKVAASAEAGVYRVAPQLMGKPVAFHLARAAGFYDGDAALEGDFDKLVAAGIVMPCGPGAVRVAIDCAALAATRGAARSQARGGFRNRGGRPRAGETAEEARMRREREAAEGTRQRNLTLVQVHEGGVSGAEIAVETSWETRGETSEKTSEVFGGGFRKPGSAVDGETAETRVSRAGPMLAAVAAEMNDVESTSSQQQAATQSLSPACQGACAGAETSKPRGFGFTGAEPGETGNLETSEVSAAPFPVASMPVASGPDVAAGLAREAASLFVWNVENRRRAPGIMLEYLKRGYAADEIRAVMQAKRGQRINSANAFRDALADARRAAVLVARAGPAGAVRPGAGRPAARNGAIEMQLRAEEQQAAAGGPPIVTMRSLAG